MRARIFARHDPDTWTPGDQSLDWTREFRDRRAAEAMRRRIEDMLRPPRGVTVEMEILRKRGGVEARR